jgi:hypothetical protein
MKAKMLLWLKNFWLKSKKTIIIIGLFIGLLIIAYIAGKCSTRQEQQQSLNNLIAARDSVKQSFITIEGLEYSVATKDAIILTKDQAIEAGLLREDILKKLHIKDVVTNAELSGQIKMKDSLLSLPDKTEYITIKDSSGIKKNYIRYPFQLLKEHSEYLSLDAGLDSLKQAWFKLNVPVVGTMTIGYQRDGLFKTKPIGVFVSPNKNLTITQSNILIVEEPKKWYDRKLVWFLGGIGVEEGLRWFLTR